MRAVRIHELGGVEGLQLDELPDPRPGPGEVAVRVRATSLNFRDLLMVKGSYNRRMPLPAVPLSDGAGEVAEVGPGVERFRPGDRVAAAFMPGWVDGPPTEVKFRSALGGGGTGMLAEVVVLPEGGLVALPSYLSFEEAATLPCAGVTAWHALVTEGAIETGQTVLVQGTGGVSLFALQFAVARGARVIITSSSDAKLERALALGASDGINYRTNPEWDEAARALTDGVGVDHVVEVGGAGTLIRSLRAARVGGRISLIGVLSGAETLVPLFPFLMKNLRAQGIYVGSRVMFETMNALLGRFELRPVIDRVFTLEEAADAYRHLESGAHFGKVVVRV